MIRVDRSELTRHEIIRVAANRFLNDGYSKTTIGSMAKSLNMSTGNMTFHFPTKEHLLATLVEMLCDFQWELMEKETKEGNSSLMAICLELLSMASACEQDEVAREFFVTAYISPLSLDIIRKRDKARSKMVYGEYCTDWTDERFAEAETLVSGIEFSTLLTTIESAPLETRISGALDTILSIYNVPEDIRKQNIGKALSLDYQKFGVRILKEFREYVDQTTEQALFDLLKRKKSPSESERKQGILLHSITSIL